MKSVYDPSVRNELVQRINSLSQENKAQWGKMDVYQMVKHCILCEQMFSGELPMKRVFIGRLIGGMVLRKILKDEKPFGRNSPTSPLLKTTSERGDIEPQKKEWINKIEQYANYENKNFVHPFFGPMTREQIGLFAYKHADHHLRQFGA